MFVKPLLIGLTFLIAHRFFKSSNLSFSTILAPDEGTGSTWMFPLSVDLNPRIFGECPLWSNRNRSSFYAVRRIFSFSLYFQFCIIFSFACFEITLGVPFPFPRWVVNLKARKEKLQSVLCPERTQKVPRELLKIFLFQIL